MSNIIALVWDFDKTMIRGYMQDPIFKKFGINSKEFWDRVKGLPAHYNSIDIRVNPETIYLNEFITEARNGSLQGLNNAQLRAFGQEMDFYDGVCEFLPAIKEHYENDKIYREYDVKVEHYIVSTGFRQVIEGTCIRDQVEFVWGCEFIEKEDDKGNMVISEIGFSIDNTSKTRALFEINKGTPKDIKIEVNATIPEENRRVQFKNMIYIADGPSDIPAFSLINKYNGHTLGVYPKGDREALAQVENLRQEKRVNMIGEADYSKDTTTRLWLERVVEILAERIVQDKVDRLHKSVSAPPKHLT